MNSWLGIKAGCIAETVECLAIGHAVLYADRDCHCRAAAMSTLAMDQQPIRIRQVSGEVEHLLEMNGGRMPRIFGNNRNIVHDNVKMVRAKHVSAHGSQRDNPGRPAL